MPIARPGPETLNEWEGDYTLINEEVPNFGTYVYSDPTPDISKWYVTRLTPLTDPGVRTGHVIRFWVKDVDANETGGLEVQLVDGDTNHLIWTTFLTDFGMPTGSWTAFEEELSEAEAAQITNYGYIKLAFLTGAVDAGDAWAIAWAEFEVPGGESAYAEGCNPDTGGQLGGTDVIIYRAAGGLTNAAKVRFGTGTAYFGTSLTIIDDQTLSIKTPAHAPATVDVVVTITGDADITFAAGFTFTPFGGYIFPTIISIDPNTDTVLGGELVTITGIGFMPGAQIYFDETLADDITYVSDTTYTCRVPPHELGIAQVSMRQP